MTQIVVTLDNTVDENLLRRMIENMKGVLKTSLRHHKDDSKTSSASESQWLESLHSIKDAIDQSVIDTSDSRTQYLMSK